MKNDLIDALGGVDAELIEHAEQSRGGRLPQWLVPAIAAAAALLLVFVFIQLINAGKPEKQQDAQATLPPATGLPQATLPPATGLPHATAVPDPDDNSQYSYMAVLYYKGNGYSQQGRAVPEADIRGEYIGSSNVGPENWTAPGEGVEFSANFPWPCYTVKGVDPRFMLCAKLEDGYYLLFTRLDLSEFTQGEALFEDVLHLSRGEPALSFESMDSWNNGYHEVYRLKTEQRSAAAAFVDALLSSERAGDDVVTSMDSMKWHITLALENGLGLDLLVFPDGTVLITGSAAGGRYDVGRAAFDALDAVLSNPENSRFTGAFPYASYTLADCMADPQLGKLVPSVPEGYRLVTSLMYRSFDGAGAVNGTKGIYLAFEKEYACVMMTLTDEEHFAYYRFYPHIPVLSPDEATAEGLTGVLNDRQLYCAVRFGGGYMIIDANEQNIPAVAGMIEEIAARFE